MIDADNLVESTHFAASKRMNSTRSWEDLSRSFKLLEMRARIRADTNSNSPPEGLDAPEKQEQSNPDAGLYRAAWSVLDAATERDNFETVKLCQRVIDAVLSGRQPEKFDVDILNILKSEAEMVHAPGIVRAGADTAAG